MAKRTIKDSILNTPILETEKLYILNDNDENKTLDAYDTELKKREIALYESYGLQRPEIIESHTRALIKNMARELNIRGFYQTNEVKEPGAPQKWKSYDGALLWARVELKKLNATSKQSLRSIIASVIREHPKDYHLKHRTGAKTLKSTKKPDDLLIDIIYKRYEDIIKSKPWPIQLIPLLKQMCNNERTKAAKKLRLEPPEPMTDQEFLDTFFIFFCEQGVAKS